jgi:hypothetical protein
MSILMPPKVGQDAEFPHLENELFRKPDYRTGSRPHLPEMNQNAYLVKDSFAIHWMLKTATSFFQNS